MMGFLEGLRLDTLLKRVCKSLLKKRLGDLILGDLDLDQFDIQLGRGRVQLNDLALNAEFINRKVRFFLSARPHACPRDSRVFFSQVCWVGGVAARFRLGAEGGLGFVMFPSLIGARMLSGRSNCGVGKRKTWR